MKIMDILVKDAVVLDVVSRTKRELLEAQVALAIDHLECPLSPVGSESSE